MSASDQDQPAILLSRPTPRPLNKVTELKRSGNNNKTQINCKGKGKAPRHEDVLGEWRYSSTH